VPPLPQPPPEWWDGGLCEPSTIKKQCITQHEGTKQSKYNNYKMLILILNLWKINDLYYVAFTVSLKVQNHTINKYIHK
jgi:hypothetical protein